MIDASILSELTTLGLSGPQHDKVLSILSRLLVVISEQETQLAIEKERGKWRVNNEKRRSQPSGVSPKEKSNPPSPSVLTDGAKVAQSVNDLVWTECPFTLQKLGLSERSARSNVGRWLKQTKSPERVLEAVRSAALAGTQDPIPYIVEALKPKVIAFGKDWDSGAARQIKARDEGPKISEEERQANLAKLRNALRNSIKAPNG